MIYDTETINYKFIQLDNLSKLIISIWCLPDQISGTVQLHLVFTVWDDKLKMLIILNFPFGKGFNKF